MRDKRGLLESAAGKIIIMLLLLVVVIFIIYKAYPYMRDAISKVWPNV